MKHEDNKYKRYALTGILLALALFLGVEKCTDDSSDLSDDSPVASIETPVPATRAYVDSIAAPKRYQRVPVFSTDSKPYVMAATRRTALKQTKDTIVQVKDTLVQAQDMQQVPTAPSKTDGTGRKPLPQQRDTIYSERPTTTQPVTPIASFPHTHLFRVGVRAGMGYSWITGLGGILESYNMRPQFTMGERGGIVPRVGVFGTWQYGRLGSEFGVDYTRLSSKVTEHKTVQDVTETTQFHYNFITPQLLIRFYVFPKFYMGAGVSMSFPFGGRNIDFTDNRTGEIYRQQAERTRGHLRETIKPCVLLSPTIKIGFADPKSGIEAGLEYSYGVNDLLHTNMNDYGYQERTNNAHNVSLTIGYSIPLNKEKKTTAHEEK